MKPNQIPISTAISDQAWFHDHKSQDYVFIDKNGVINGLRAPVFAPGLLCSGECEGRENCTPPSPNTCTFLRLYRNQLAALDFDNIMERLNSLVERCKPLLQTNLPIQVILLVHEAPNNPCSERVPIQEWFASHGVEVKEWTQE